MHRGQGTKKPGQSSEVRLMRRGTRPFAKMHDEIGIAFGLGPLGCFRFRFRMRLKISPPGPDYKVHTRDAYHMLSTRSAFSCMYVMMRLLLLRYSRVNTMQSMATV